MNHLRTIRLGRTATVALVVVVLVAAAFVPALLGPRTSGLSGDWSAPAVEGRVVAGRALVSGGNAALDLRTGKSVRLGSVVGGTAFYADDRLIVLKGERVDSVKLDASVRWTWRAEQGHRAIPLAASRGSTLVADCPPATAARCRLVGLNSAGKQDWEALDADRPTEPPREALPRVHVRTVRGGGVLVTDPVSGRSTLQPGSSLATVPDGPVVVTVDQGGQCVVSAYAAPDPLWTRVLGPCPGGKLPAVEATANAVQLRWSGRTETLATTTGTTEAAPREAAVRGVLARSGSLLVTRRVSHPFWGDVVRRGRAQHVLEVRDTGTGDVRSQLVTYDPVHLLALEPDAVVVRADGQVVRYTVDE